MSDNQNTLKDLAKARALFQLRTLQALMTEMPHGSKHDQEAGDIAAQEGKP